MDVHYTSRPGDVPESSDLSWTLKEDYSVLKVTIGVVP